MKEEGFRKILSNFIGYKISVYTNNSPYVEGHLIDVKSDHFIIRIGPFIYYYDINQLHAFSKNIKYSRPIEDGIPHEDKNSFKDIISRLKYRWVTINSSSEQSFTGLMNRITDDHVMLINNKEQYYIQKAMITDITEGLVEQKIDQIEADSESLSSKSTLTERKPNKSSSTSSSKSIQSKLELKETNDVKVEKNETIDAIKKRSESYHKMKQDNINNEPVPERLPIPEAMHFISNVSPSSERKDKSFPTKEDIYQIFSNVLGTNRKECNLTSTDIHETFRKNQYKENSTSINNEINKAENNHTKKMHPLEQKQLLEAQYFALFKHARKMYLQLKKERLKENDSRSTL